MGNPRACKDFIYDPSVTFWHVLKGLERKRTTEEHRRSIRAQIKVLNLPYTKGLASVCLVNALPLWDTGVQENIRHNSMRVEERKGK